MSYHDNEDDIMNQVRVIGEFNPKELVANSVEEIAAWCKKKKNYWKS